MMVRIAATMEAFISRPVRKYQPEVMSTSWTMSITAATYLAMDCVVRTAVHFRKEDPVEQVPALERAGQEAGSDRGALLAVQWHRGMD